MPLHCPAHYSMEPPVIISFCYLLFPTLVILVFYLYLHLLSTQTGPIIPLHSSLVPPFFVSPLTIAQLCPIGKRILLFSFSFHNFCAMMKISLTNIKMFFKRKSVHVCPDFACYGKVWLLIYENVSPFFFLVFPVSLHMPQFSTAIWLSSICRHQGRD